MSKTVISLTTIPPRVGLIRPTLESLIQQDAAIDKITLWIPRAYRRAEFGEFDIPAMPDGVEIKRCDVDYGPATKVLPAVAEYLNQDVRILYCDDDRIYDRDWASHLLAYSDRHPGACITHAGEVIESIAKKFAATGLWYKFLTYATFGIRSHYHRKRIRELDPGIGLVDICKGYGGVLVRPDFFSAAAFDIPDLLWTVDDIWLSGHLAVKGIEVWKVSRAEKARKTDAAVINSLIDYIYREHAREQANMACIQYFQEKYGIWRKEESGPAHLLEGKFNAEQNSP
jgi:hypothetical protein